MGKLWKASFVCGSDEFSQVFFYQRKLEKIHQNHTGINSVVLMSSQEQNRLISVLFVSNEEYHPDLSSLSWLFGVWESVEAEMCYPTVEGIKYNEVAEFQPSSNPLVEYKSDTWHPEKKTKLHQERGFLKINPETQKVALLMAHHFGITEISEGCVENETLNVESQSISQMSICDIVATKKIVRKWALEGDELHCTVLMQTANQPLQLHLKSRYKKKC